MRRQSVARQHGQSLLSQMPIVIGNAMPKSGSHLLHQILLGLTKIAPLVNPGMPPLTRSDDNVNLSTPQVIEKLKILQEGDIAYGYFQALPEYVKALTAKNVASLFMTRDPRDVLVSHVFYATEMYPGHGMHHYYNSLPSMETRLNAAIAGVNEKGLHLSSIRAKYDRYLAWLSTPAVNKVTFEMLILDQERGLRQILDYLMGKGLQINSTEKEAISLLKAAIQPRKSGTFRGGRVGDWRQHFTDANKDRFKEETRDLLQILHYEKDEQW